MEKFDQNILLLGDRNHHHHISDHRSFLNASQQPPKVKINGHDAY